jgi:hypothetical protein
MNSLLESLVYIFRDFIALIPGLLYSVIAIWYIHRIGTRIKVFNGSKTEPSIKFNGLLRRPPQDVKTEFLLKKFGHLVSFHPSGRYSRRQREVIHKIMVAPPKMDVAKKEDTYFLNSSTSILWRVYCLKQRLHWGKILQDEEIIIEEIYRINDSDLEVEIQKNS